MKTIASFECVFFGWVWMEQPEVFEKRECFTGRVDMLDAFLEEYAKDMGENLPADSIQYNVYLNGETYKQGSVSLV